MILEISGAPDKVLQDFFYKVAVEDMGEALRDVEDAYQIDHYGDFIEVVVDIEDRNYYWENVMVSIGEILEEDYNVEVMTL